MIRKFLEEHDRKYTLILNTMDYCDNSMEPTFLEDPLQRFRLRMNNLMFFIAYLKIIVVSPLDVADIKASLHTVKKSFDVKIMLLND